MTPILRVVLGVVVADGVNLRRCLLLAAGTAAVITLSWLAPYPVVAATNSQGAARVTPRLVDLVAALAAGAVGSALAGATHSTSSKSISAVRLGLQRQQADLRAIAVHAHDAVLGGERRYRLGRDPEVCSLRPVVIGSLRRSSALPPSAITIRMLSLLTRSSG